MHHAQKPAGLAGMFLKTIEATNANGLAARPAVRATSLAAAPAPHAVDPAPEPAPAPALPPQSRLVARSLLRSVAAIDANGLVVLRTRATNVAEPEPIDPASPRAKLRAHLRRFTGGGSQ